MSETAWLLAATTPSRIAPAPSKEPPPLPLPTLWERRAWMIARVAAAIGLCAFFADFVHFRFENAWHHFSLQGDQHQSIGHYWRYAVKGAIPPGHLISDYAFAYHAPPIWWAVMATASKIADPLIAAKISGVLAYALYALIAAVMVGRRTDWLLGFIVAILVLRTPPDMPEQITGGMARAFAPSLLLLFLWAFMERRHRLALVLLVLQAGIYPSIVIPCGITYGLYCVLKGPMNERVRRCAGMFVAGLLVILLGKAQDFRSPKSWGDTVTYEEALKMPAWGNGGRFHETPHRRFEEIMRGNLVRPYRELGWRPASAGAVKFAEQHNEGIFLVTPLLVASLGMLVGLARRRRWRGLPEVGPFPWQLLALFGGSTLAWLLVRTFAFKLFLPSRQLGFTIQFLVVTGVPLLVWYGTRSAFPRQRLLAVLVAVLFAVVPAFAFRGTGLQHSGAGYRFHHNEQKTYEFLRTLPLDQEIACDVTFCEFLMPMAQHVPYAARNLTHPLRKGYYEEAERRLVEMHRVLFATSLAEIANFVAKEHVRYIVYDTASVKATKPKTYKPADQKISKIMAAGGSKPRLLLTPPKAAVLFRDGNRVVLDLSKFTKLDPVPVSNDAVFGPETAPVFGPQPEPAPTLEPTEGKRATPKVDLRHEPLRKLPGPLPSLRH